MATFSAIIGVITLTFSLLIYELDILWLVLDLVGMTVAYIGLRKGDKNCRLGLVLCAIAGIFSFGMTAFIVLMSKR